MQGHQEITEENTFSNSLEAFWEDEGIFTNTK